jgi:hypothetical protein
MVWDTPISGFSGKAQVNFLYNPSTVEADYSMSTPGVAASLLFPNANDTSDLRVPLNQTVEFSLLFDRTYELWGSYNSAGQSTGAVAGQSSSGNASDPGSVGVLSDIFAMQQFTGMTVGYNSSGGTVVTVPNAGAGSSFLGYEGVLQMIPSYIYFGSTANLSYYGYITEWDVQITHWTQYMVPMRCVIDVSFNMLPGNVSTAGTTAPGIAPTPSGTAPTPIGVLPSTSNAGKSGR